MTICKGAEEAGSCRWSFATIRAPPSLWFWSSEVQSSLQITFAKERRRPDHLDDHLQQSLLLRPLDFGHPENRPLCKWLFAKEWRRPDHPNDNLQQSVLLCPLNFGHPEDLPLYKWPFVPERRNNCREEQLSWGTLSGGTLRDIDIWWYWVKIGRYWLVLGDTGSV